MKKLIALFLLVFSTSVFAEIYSQSLLPLLSEAKVKRYKDSVYVKITVAQTDWCYVLSPDGMQNVPRTWTPAIDLIASNMIPLTPAQIVACNGTYEWRVAKSKSWGIERADRPLYDYTQNAKGKTIGRALVNTLCEGTLIIQSRGSKEWQYVTNVDGKRGIVLCEEILVVTLTGSIN